MASLMFSMASDSVRPWDQHPGSPGQETLTPSSVWVNTILYLIDLLLNPLHAILSSDLKPMAASVWDSQCGIGMNKITMLQQQGPVNMTFAKGDRAFDHSHEEAHTAEAVYGRSPGRFTGLRAFRANGSPAWRCGNASKVLPKDCERVHRAETAERGGLWKKRDQG